MLKPYVGHAIMRYCPSFCLAFDNTSQIGGACSFVLDLSMDVPLAARSLGSFYFTPIACFSGRNFFPGILCSPRQTQMKKLGKLLQVLLSMQTAQESSKGARCDFNDNIFRISFCSSFYNIDRTKPLFTRLNVVAWLCFML